jgi:steroid delta-isomerase-like uncharacterized protein
VTHLERWFEEVWNKGSVEAIDEMLSPESKGQGLRSADGKHVDDMTAFKEFHRNLRSAFPDIKITVEDTVTEGDKQVARCLVTGTHTGEGLGRPATGKKVKFHGMSMIRMKDGKTVESWNNFDFLTMQRQLDAPSDDQRQAGARRPLFSRK